MKKFKHKITGDIVSQTGDRYTLNTTLLPKQWIENSNDWEEIKENKLLNNLIFHFQINNIKQDYEILSLIDNNNKQYWFPNLNSENISEHIKFYEHEYGGNSVKIGENGSKIYSIKRLNDNKIFTLGENVEHSIWKGPIINFILSEIENGRNNCFVSIDCGDRILDYLLNVITKIKPRDYEILEFRFKGEKDFSWKLIKNDTYKSKGMYTRTLDEMFNFNTSFLKESPFIYSVKRLSDGKIFTIGDKINCQKDQNQILLEIQIYNEKIRFKMEFQKNHGWDSSYTLDFINKPAKLFTTEDGIDIFEGDSWYYVLTDCLSNTSKPSKTNSIWIAINLKNFSTLKAAEEYILLNKSCLSISDLESLIELGGLAHIIKNAKLLAKNRTKL